MHHFAEAPRQEAAERRCTSLIGLACSLASGHDWSELARSVAHALDDGSGASARLLALTSDGHQDLGCWPTDHGLPSVPHLDLSRAARKREPTTGPEGTALVGLHADGVTLGVLQTEGSDDYELLTAVAPLIACRFSVLASQGVDGILFAPEAVEQASDESAVIADFAQHAKRRLEHDRLSVYLLSPDGRAFERFAVATSRIVPGEGVLIPFEDVGLKHIVLNNEPLVSSDIGADPRILGREDRVIAEAGFRGLLSVPLRRRGRPFGVLNFVSREPGFYSREDIPVAEEIADQIAIFVENLRQQRRTQALVRQEARESERARLARDVYHAVSQAVREIEATASDLETELGADSPHSDGAKRIRRLAEEELAGLRRAVIDMDPVDFERHDLEEVARIALAAFKGNETPVAELDLRGDTTDIPATTLRPIYRILQEALMNARLHAQASKVRVSIDMNRDMRMSVEDDGRGFNPAEASRASGLGLRHMRDRTQALGGFLTLASEPGGGTTVKLTVPVVREQYRAAASDAQRLQAGPTAEGTLRVIVTEGSPLLRAGRCRMVERGSQMRIVGEAASVEQLRRATAQLHPDVIVLSAALVNGDFRTVVSEIREASPSSAVLVMSEGIPGGEADMLFAGVNGVLPSEVDQEGFARAVRAVAEGAKVFPAADQKPGKSSAFEGLTERERSVLALVAAGCTNSEIAADLYLATKTVERQVATIVRKLNARNRSHAAAIAVARRIVQLPDGSAV